MISDVVPPTGDALFVLESCHSTWIFDTDRMRFRRVLKGLALDAHAATTAWRAYYGLEIDPISESFVVLLESGGHPPAPVLAPRGALPAVRREPDRRALARRAAERLAGLSARALHLEVDDVRGRQQEHRQRRQRGHHDGNGQQA